MSFVRILVFFSVLIAVNSAQKGKDCAVKNHVTVENPWQEFNKNVKEAPENLLCFVKCVYVEGGYLDGDGKLEMTKLNKAIDEWVKLSDAEKAEANTCLKSVAPVKTCADMKPINACIYKSKV